MKKIIIEILQRLLSTRNVQKVLFPNKIVRNKFPSQIVREFGERKWLGRAVHVAVFIHPRAKGFAVKLIYEIHIFYWVGYKQMTVLRE